MKKGRNKLLLAAGIGVGAAAVAAAGAYATAKLLVKTALDREAPKIMKNANKNIAGSERDEKNYEQCRIAAERLAAVEHEIVKITSYDGLSLTGHFYPNPKPERVIIAFHGWRSSWKKDFGMISDFWFNNGCSVLFVEQRGQNNSEGNYMGFGLQERFDCVKWAEWIACRCGKNIPVYLAGVSMGATTVLMSSDLKFSISINGIMADCGFTSPKEIWRHIAKNNLHISYGIRSKMADEICKKKISTGPGDFSSTEALKNTKIPVLFVHGSDDCFVPVGMTYENYKACASEKRLLIVPGADHSMSYCVNKDEYEKSVLDFWEEFDKQTR